MVGSKWKRLNEKNRTVVEFGKLDNGRASRNPEEPNDRSIFLEIR